MTKKPKPITGWAIESTCGIFIDTTRKKRTDAIALILDLPKHNWQSFRRLGFRCVKVEIKKVGE